MRSHLSHAALEAGRNIRVYKYKYKGANEERTGTILVASIKENGPAEDLHDAQDGSVAEEDAPAPAASVAG